MRVKYSYRYNNNGYTCFYRYDLLKSRVRVQYECMGAKSLMLRGER